MATTNLRTPAKVIADINDLVASVNGVVTAELRPVAADTVRPVPCVHAILPCGAEFKVLRPTFTAARLELIDWLKERS